MRRLCKPCGKVALSRLPPSPNQAMVPAVCVSLRIPNVVVPKRTVNMLCSMGQKLCCLLHDVFSQA